MKREYDRLLRASGWIPVSCALATNSRFHLVLVTGYVPGTSIRELLAAGSSLYDPLTGVAHLLRRLHDNTRTSCDREREFAYFHEVLDQNRLPAHQREWFNRLLGAWWHSTRIGQDEGCMARGDATPATTSTTAEPGRSILKVSGTTPSHPRSRNPRCRDQGIGRGNVRAEDHIGHFLWYYSESEVAFRRHTADLPFFMALGYLGSPGCPGGRLNATGCSRRRRHVSPQARRGSGCSL